MTLIYEIDETKLGIEYYIKLYNDRVEIKKNKVDNSPTLTTGQAIGRFIKEMTDTQYTELVIPLNAISKVLYKPANSVLATGILQICVKGENLKKATFLNITKFPNAINFGKKYDDTARKIKQYIENNI